MFAPMRPSPTIASCIDRPPHRRRALRCSSISTGRTPPCQTYSAGMIFGTHAIVYAEDADKARQFFRDVLGFDDVDAGGGWLIFSLPPAELAGASPPPTPPAAAPISFSSCAMTSTRRWRNCEARGCASRGTWRTSVSASPPPSGCQEPARSACTSPTTRRPSAGDGACLRAGGGTPPDARTSSACTTLREASSASRGDGGCCALSGRCTRVGGGPLDQTQPLPGAGSGGRRAGLRRLRHLDQPAARDVVDVAVDRDPPRHEGVRPDTGDVLGEAARLRST